MLIKEASTDTLRSRNVPVFTAPKGRWSTGTLLHGVHVIGLYSHGACMQMASSTSSGGEEKETLPLATSGDAPDDVEFPVGSRVDVWFPKDEEWFSASVLKSDFQKRKVAPRGAILCDYDTDGVIEWVLLHETEVRTSTTSPPIIEPNDVDDPFPAGTDVHVWWKDEKVWYGATVLKTRTHTKDWTNTR